MMDDPQADAMGGGAERTAAFADMVERLSRVLPPTYGEQCADTDGLAALDETVNAQQTWPEDVDWAAEAEAMVRASLGQRPRATLERENAQLRLECQRLIEVERRTYERFEAITPRQPIIPRQPLSAGWHHLACVTVPQPKPLPARALNARHRGGLITHPGDH